MGAVFALENKNSEMKIRVVRKADAIFENQNSESNVLSFQTHMCNMPFMFKPNKETTLKHLFSLLKRNLCSEYNVECSEKKKFNYSKRSNLFKSRSSSSSIGGGCCQRVQ